ncbi:HTH-type transcriptional regulator DmlR [Marinomonas gallaica]|uniref:HTH-type transcriptional regulator DmlR n=1 Tax=Marinomonas gallaica TaxID=1806667 RepID=A0A1C3JUH9_9GAMM|nr:LysR family transcriptional regulator [Marinomonas gallaica]SBT18864.1 HTH-type transcriptional regulator DmlR [Marinomonas gallaica]SBT21819.1 HTH-type transcriptional regulator DmlR [Marinomonas gallaica]
MDKFSDMTLFVSIVKNQGLAAAGRELGLSPATVTARMQALESRYGVKLLNRSTRHISLTDAGAMYHQSCIDIIDRVKETENILHTGIIEVRGTLKICAPRDIGKQYISPIISEFCELYPDVIPYLYLNDNLSNVMESGLDLVIRYGELADSNLVSRKLVSSQRVLCASPKYLRKRGTPIIPQDLVNHDCLVMVRSNEELKTWYFQDAEHRRAITVIPKRFSDDGEIIRQWALDGIGIAMKSYIDVQEDIKTQRLVTVLNAYTKNFNSSTSSAGADLNVIYPSRQHQPKRLRLFVDFLIAHFSENT